MRLLLGLLKGGIIGGGLGYGFTQLGSIAQASWASYVLYGAIGALVGIVAGRPFWRHETFWTPLIKGLFGFGVGVGLYALAVKVLGDPKLTFVGLDARLSGAPYVLGGLIGILYGIFVEVDDGGKADAKSEGTKPGPKA
ncbi:MAG: hypothetical protein IT371_21215 [Deltaproteobacteria bacterium]|nr:hypothetical protein [Deltaproteobacteria bacterium]